MPAARTQLRTAVPPHRAASAVHPLQLAALVALLATVALVSLRRKLVVLGADVFWHLKTGDWILQHHAFPHTGLFSRTAADRSWAAYSWGYELLLAAFYRRFGLLGIGIFGAALTVMVAFCVFWMARRLSGRFWYSCLLAAVTCYAFQLLRIVPRPAFFSMALFAVVLLLVLDARRTGRVQRLYPLPLLFLLWANLHIQFIYGLAVLALLLFVEAAQRLTAKSRLAAAYLVPHSLPMAETMLISALCLMATFIGPYSYHLYEIIYRYSHARTPYAMVQELQPFGLRGYASYLQLLLAAAAFIAVGWKNKLDLFKLLLLVLTTAFAFRTMRDAWFQCIAAAACIADGVTEADEREPAETKMQLAAALAAALLVTTIGAYRIGYTRASVQRAMSDYFPIDAANFIQQRSLRGPLWSIFDWGGFLIWYLPDYPVGIDGRTDLYGDVMVKRFYDTESATSGYRQDPYLNESGVVLARTKDPLTRALEADPRYDKLYTDPIATVFARALPRTH